MKYIKLSLFALLILPLSSCLKTENDFAGMRTDEGNIVTAIMEQQYLTGDNNNLGFGYGIYASFDFAAPATESVRFFTLHIAQPKNKKVSGNMTVKISATAAPGASMPPAGSITIPAEISVPAQGGTAYDFPVRFSVNKATLDPAGNYGITFTITAVSQGVYSELEKSVDVYINNAKFLSRYKVTTSVSDANNAFGIDNNTRSILLEDVANDRFDIFDWYLGSFGIVAANKVTGATTALFNPRYVVDPANGKLLAVYNRSTNTNLSATIDASSGYTATANDNRTFIAKYTVNLTVAGVTRAFTISEKYVWDAPQAF